MKRTIIVLSLVVMLFAAYAPAALADGPVCVPPANNDTWGWAAYNACVASQAAKERVSRDWNNIGNDAFGADNLQRFSQGLQGTYDTMTNGGFFNCTSYRQVWDAYSGQYVTTCAQ
jgi:hypothetical protein